MNIIRHLDVMDFGLIEYLKGGRVWKTTTLWWFAFDSIIILFSVEVPKMIIRTVGPDRKEKRKKEFYLFYFLQSRY